MDPHFIGWPVRETVNIAITPEAASNTVDVTMHRSNSTAT
jgi:hypothetical protein